MNRPYMQSLSAEAKAEADQGKASGGSVSIIARSRMSEALAASAENKKSR